MTLFGRTEMSDAIALLGYTLSDRMIEKTPQAVI
ncbi:MAG: hypothetical protein AVDCRST_MAG15-3271 [uncultured Rubellimicrobium sp.]|uniref:Uncharacterized protein n=1 Tax=uncultured Rubellimicrobium sp. TaxID=543078 RepID=A0A6J4QAC8_9RHOB|nr:MAG: hypothetical protein AVDCRST_MAG15-3271 [uncultured Rubellimicrobium sp.]